MAIAAFALVLALLAAGWASARLALLPADAPDTLNGFVIYLCLPALVLARVPGLHLRADLAVLVALPWLLLVVAAALILVVARRLAWEREVVGALLLCVPLGNTAFLGYPMVGALFGEDAVRLAMVYDQLGSFLMLPTWGLLVQGRYAGGATPSARAMALRVVKFPPFLALVVALLPWRLPPSAHALVQPILERVGDALVPVAMFAVGLTLRLAWPRRPSALAVGLVVKMALMPLVAWLAMRALGSRPEVMRVAVLESAMPAMITAGALAMAGRLAPELAAALVGWGIVAATVTLPLIAWLLR